MLVANKRRDVCEREKIPLSVFSAFLVLRLSNILFGTYRMLQKLFGFIVFSAIISCPPNIKRGKCKRKLYLLILEILFGVSLAKMCIISQIRRVVKEILEQILARGDQFQIFDKRTAVEI